jgi:hypothetical protein
MRRCRQHSHVSAITAIGVLTFLHCAANVGCNEPEPPPAAYAGPTLARGDLGLSGEPRTEPTGYSIIETGTTVGRFPGSLAVAKLGKPDPLFAGWNMFVKDDEWMVATMETKEAVQYTSLFDTVPLVQQVVVMDSKSTVSPAARREMMIGAAQRDGADLLLIFGHRSAEPDHAALAGVIYDTFDGHQVAYLQADAGPADFKIPRADMYDEDQSHEDVNYLVQRKFHYQLWQCVRELIARDQRSPTTKPNPFKDYWGSPRQDYLPVYVIPDNSFKRH